MHISNPSGLSYEQQSSSSGRVIYRFRGARRKEAPHMRIEFTDWLRAARTFLALSLAFAGTAQPQPVTHRPITDFTNAQVLGAIGMTTPSTCIPPQCAGRLASFDYPGLADRVLSTLGRPLGTTIDGSITERLLPDGRADVQVVLHTTNALSWVSTW